MATNYKPDAERVSTFANHEPGPRAFDEADGRWGESAASGSQLEVRSYNLADCTSIGQLPYRYELHHPESDTDVPRTLHLIARKLLKGETSGSPLFVARGHGGTLLGALQCQQVGADDRWQLQYLLSDLQLSPENPVPIALLEYAIKQAGWRGARRVLAQSEADSPLSGTLRKVGFSAFAREYVYASSTVPDGFEDRTVRVQENSDVWGIHQLYLQTTPRDVQNAEALTSHEWDLELEGRSRKGWIIASDTGAKVFARVHTTRKLHRIDTMFAPDAIGHMPRLLNAVFAALQFERPRPVFVAIRGYQQELESVLIHAGFTLDTDQLMMVRYTTVSVPVRSSEGFELLRPAESDPRRVPSFCVRDMHE